MIERKAQWNERGPYLQLFLASPPRRPRWITCGFTFGQAPGSIGSGTRVHLWRVWNGDPERDGLGLRLFHSYRRPCLTFLVHWRTRGVGG